MRRKILLSVFLVVLVCASLGGATFAYFTDSAINNNNTFIAGTLNLESIRGMGDSVDGPMFYVNEEEGWTYDDTSPPISPPYGPGATGLWAPGDSHSRILQISNMGSLDGQLQYVRANLESGSRALTDKLEVTVTASSDLLEDEVVASGSLGEFIDNDQFFIGGPIYIPGFDPVWEEGGLVNLTFTVSFPEDGVNDNVYQGLGAVIGFEVFADQARNNP